LRALALAKDRIAGLSADLAGATAEVGRLSLDNARLQRRLLDHLREAEEARQAAEQLQQEAAFRLGRNQALSSMQHHGTGAGAAASPSAGSDRSTAVAALLEQQERLVSQELTLEALRLKQYGAGSASSGSRSSLFQGATKALPIGLPSFPDAAADQGAADAARLQQMQQQQQLLAQMQQQIAALSSLLPGVAAGGGAAVAAATGTGMGGAGASPGASPSAGGSHRGAGSLSSSPTPSQYSLQADAQRQRRRSEGGSSPSPSEASALESAAAAAVAEAEDRKEREAAAAAAAAAKAEKNETKRRRIVAGRSASPSAAAASTAAAVAAASSESEPDTIPFALDYSHGTYPTEGAYVDQIPSDTAPPGGWTIYVHPPAGTAWPSNMPFFRPLMEIGIPVLKHGRMGKPHRRLLWFDMSDPSSPHLVWQDTGARNPAKVKAKDRLSLFEINNIMSGRAGAVFQRSGKEEHAGRYLVFSCDRRSLDIEVPSTEAREWLFAKFGELFHAYAATQREGLQGEAITLRLANILDGVGNKVPGARRKAASQRHGKRTEPASAADIAAAVMKQAYAGTNGRGGRATSALSGGGLSGMMTAAQVAGQQFTHEYPVASAGHGAARDY
jgi:hypothetical protein